MSQTTIGIIGGTGLYDMPGLAGVEKLAVDTPFGAPSSEITCGTFAGVRLLFIARHGVGHRLLPSEINYRANIFALKSLGAQWCIAVSAVGSLREEFEPGHLVIPDQLIDRTRGRASTFFGRGIVAHVAFADPYCPVLRTILFETSAGIAERHGTKSHNGAAFVVMEGPAFSTRAESHLYRSFGASIIGMTGLPEAKLAREAELSYAALALVTDYDCWRSEDADVDVPDILALVKKNADLAREVLTAAVPRIAESERSALARDALQHAIITAPEAIPQQVKAELEPILSRYFGER